MLVFVCLKFLFQIIYLYTGNIRCRLLLIIKYGALLKSRIMTGSDILCRIASHFKLTNIFICAYINFPLFLKHFLLEYNVIYFN